MAESSTPGPSPLGDWYGHIFTADRHKCILFINEPTLFVSLACWVVKSRYRQIVPFFVESLTLTLRNQAFHPDEIDFILGLHKDTTVGRTLNSTMIGSLNNRVSNAKSMLQWHGGYGYCDCRVINIGLNETPMKPIGYSNGMERMRSLLSRLGRVGKPERNP
ncbi:MAG: hypothetical protein ABSF26_31055 [Thermoguttaceae bacterium]